jgi:hypothetical protein
MTIHSTILLYNGVADWGNGPVIGGLGCPAGLRTSHNRGPWLEGRHNPLVDGIRDWSIGEAFVLACERDGITPIALFAETTPALTADYGRDLAVKFGTRCVYEVGNEIDTLGSRLYGRSAVDGEMAGGAWRLTTDAIRMACPSAEIICGSVQSVWLTGHGLQTLASALRAYGPDLPPNISIHMYPESRPAAEITRTIHRVRGVLEAHAKSHGCKIWVTEWGFEGFSSWTPAKQLAKIKSCARAISSAGAYAALHYLFDDSNGFGFKDRDQGVQTWNQGAFQ